MILTSRTTYSSPIRFFSVWNPGDFSMGAKTGLTATVKACHSRRSAERSSHLIAFGSPLLDQTFFIGDGLTGDGTGSQQVFYVPAAAGSLYLGISDAPGYNGSPGAYGDNSGTYTVDYSLHGTVSAVPEPSFLLFLGGGLARLVFVRQRRKA